MSDLRKSRGPRLRVPNQNPMGKSITINDVAERAGVSIGTVDRVIHNRGEVSRKSTEKVRKAIEELHYEPNLHASLLASRSGKVISCLLPEGSEGSYWGDVLNALRAEEEDARRMNVKLNYFFFNMNDLSSFRKAGKDLVQSPSDGVIIAPLFGQEAAKLAEILKAMGRPYLYIDTKIEDDGCLAYIGMPKYKSGYLCASLLSSDFSAGVPEKVAVIRVRRDKAGQSDPTVNRRQGFCEYMAQNYPSCSIENIFIDPEPSEVRDMLEKTLDPEIRHIAMLNSRIWLLKDYLEHHRREGMKVIGFGSISGNLDMLREGLADIIITQHIDRLAKKAVRTMVDYLVLSRQADNKDIYTHMDILTALNLDNY